MAVLELVSSRPDWLGALTVALTLPAGVPERRSGDDPWASVGRAERPRRISDDLAWLRQAFDEPADHGLKGLEEERRLAYVGLTRARKRAFVYFAANRRVHGNWQSSLPSRFITELPPEHTDTVVDEGFYGGYVGFRDNAQAATFGSGYDSPGWKRAQANRAAAAAQRTRPPLIEAQAYTVQTSDPSTTQYARGDRVFHQKFGYGRVSAVEGNKLTVTFDHSGEKKVIDTFVTRG